MILWQTLQIIFWLGNGIAMDFARTCYRPSEQSLETISGMMLNQLQPKFAVKIIVNEKPFLKPM